MSTLTAPAPTPGGPAATHNYSYGQGNAAPLWTTRVTIPSMGVAVVAITQFSQTSLDTFTDCYGLPRLTAHVTQVTANPIDATDQEASLDTGSSPASPRS